jgi:uncharacterized protein (TIGR02391 family)
MTTIYTLFSDVNDLLKVPPEDLGPILLKLALPQLQEAGFIPSSVTQISVIDRQVGKDYPFYKKQEVERLLSRAWNLLERGDFIEPAPGMNGANGWRNFTEKGKAVANGYDIQRLHDAAEFPKSLLHPAIREPSWNALIRSSNTLSPTALVSAVRDAFIAVEEAVRAAGGYKSSDYGASLMDKAFNPDTGSMGDRDTSKTKSEREGLLTLFKGAMNAYRNPVSHRTPALEIEEAKDQLLLASHLLRIVDARRPVSP